MRSALLVLLLAACDKEPETTDDTDTTADTTDTTTDTVDTPSDTPGPTGIVPTRALMEVGLGYDAATDAAVAFTDEAGVTTQPYVRLALGADDWNGEWADTGKYCVFQLTAEGTISREPATPPEAVFGLRFVAGTPYTSTCNDAVDPVIVGDIDGKLATLDFGFAFLPTIFPDFGRELVRDGTLTVPDLDRFIGGGITGAFAAPQPLLPTALVSGFAADAAFQITVDEAGEGVRRARTEMVVDDALTSGVYRMQLFIPADNILRALVPPAP